MERLLTQAAVAAVMAVAGCANAPLTSKDAALIDASPGVDTGKVDADGEADFLLAYQYVRSAPVTTSMPNSGSARYIGGMGTDVSGGINGFMTGAIDATVTNLNNGSASAVVDNFALYDDGGNKTKDLGGAAILTGAVSGNTLAMSTTTGQIVDGANTSTVSMNMNGTFRDITDRASAVTGSVTTSGTGGFTINPTTGKFYLVEND